MHKEQALQRFRQTINDALTQLEIDLSTRVTRGELESREAALKRRLSVSRSHCCASKALRGGKSHESWVSV